MKLSKAIEYADAQRPNTISTEMKVKWIREVEADLMELMAIEELYPNEYPTVDPDLLMPEGYDGIYPFYLMAMIDDANEETVLYQNDFMMFNVAYKEARQWWARTHRPKKPVRIKGLI